MRHQSRLLIAVTAFFLTLWASLAQAFVPLLPPGERMRSEFLERLPTALEKTRVQPNRLLVLIPAGYGEAGVIGPTLDHVRQAITVLKAREPGLSVDVAVVTNGPGRESVETVNAAVERWRTTSNEDGAVALTLLSNDVPGKVPALLRAKELILREGYGRVAQIDADVRPAPDSLHHLWTTMNDGELDAASGRARWVSVDGRPLPVFHAARNERRANVPTSNHNRMLLNGQFTMSDSSVFVAGWEAVRKHMGWAHGEDGAYSLLLAAAERRTGVSPNVAWESDAPQGFREVVSQQGRWRAVDHEVASVFGRPAMRQLGLMAWDKRTLELTRKYVAQCVQRRQFGAAVRGARDAALYVPPIVRRSATLKRQAHVAAERGQIGSWASVRARTSHP